MRVYAYADLDIVAQAHSIDKKKWGGWCKKEKSTLYITFTDTKHTKVTLGQVHIGKSALHITLANTRFTKVTLEQIK